MLELLDGAPIAMSEAGGPARKGGPLKGRVLVTGGNGFIGQHLVAALVGRVEAVRVLDPSVPGHVLPGIEHVQGSVLDHTTVARALDGVTCVYHLAALANLCPRKSGRALCTLFDRGRVDAALPSRWRVR